MTCSLTLLIPHPEVTSGLQAPLLDSKSHSQAQTGTQSSMLPSNTQSATFTLKCQGKLVSLCKQVPLLHG
jgi:hypothetical protein